jgi:tripartite-type tricarboxylate transporter receptor subunit TctC
MELRRHLIIAAAAAAAASRMPLIARAQPSWPTHPVRLLLPDAPGSGNDTTARLIAPMLEAALGRPFVVENRPGAGGRIGVEAAWRAAPDGHTFLFGNAGSNGINAAIYRDLPFDLGEAFEPIALLVQGPNVLVANTRVLPVRTAAELIAALRGRPGHLNYASAGVGSSSHMSMELFKVQAGLAVQHIPYRGVPEAAQAVISGDAPLAFSNLVNVMPFLRRGEFTAIAVTSLARSRDLPDVPTLHEAVLPGYETLAWNGLLAPKGTPRAIRDRLRAALLGLKDDAGLNDRIRLLGGEYVVSTPEEFAARIRADIAKWRDLAARANIQAE